MIYFKFLLYCGGYTHYLSKHQEIGTNMIFYFIYEL